jgi:16S rRNA (uracil1498-N3)-methyltransferase
MPDRYFTDEPIAGGSVVLAGAEAHHLIHVMRAAPGQRVTLFDGSGDEFAAVVERVGRAEVELMVLAREHVDRELPFELTLGVALPKGERQRWLVEKAVELGVTRIVPLRTCRAVAQPGEPAMERLRRAVVEASKQCGRNRLLVIDRPQTWPDFVMATAGEPCRVLAHPGATASAGAAVQLPPQQSRATAGRGFMVGAPRVIAAIGPEGGFADDEVALAIAAGWQPVDLGPRILRVETAALLLAAMIVGRRGE